MHWISQYSKKYTVVNNMIKRRLSQVSIGQFLSVGGLGIFKISPIFKVWSISMSRMKFTVRMSTFFLGSRICSDSDGMLAECLLHRRSLLGALLLLVFATSRWQHFQAGLKIVIVTTFDMQIYRGEPVKMIGTHHHAEVLTSIRWCIDDNDKHANMSART